MSASVLTRPTGLPLLLPTWTLATRLSTLAALRQRGGLRWRNDGDPLSDPDGPAGPNDRVATHLRNRNPMNLERMRIARKQRGFELERRERGFWNRLDLSLTQQHTTAEVTHWTGRPVCRASTREWAIRRFLYNNTDAAAVQAVGRVLGQRCLETGVAEVYLKVEEADMKKERMRNFVSAVRESGLVIGEGPEYVQEDPHRNLMKFKRSLKPWEYPDV